MRWRRRHIVLTWAALVLAAAFATPAQASLIDPNAFASLGSLNLNPGGATAYTNEAVLLVGANPAPSPFHRDWDANRVPRIRSSSYRGGKGEFLMTWWLDQVKHGTVTRYVSAGNPGHVTFPKKYAARLAPHLAARAIVY